MSALQAPFLELSFYFTQLLSAQAYLRVITELSRLGASFTGEAYAHRGREIGHEPFASIHDRDLERVTVNTVADLVQMLDDADTRLVQTHMTEAVGLAQDAAEIVTYVAISPEAAPVDQHPVAIWTEGELFSGDLRQSESTKPAGLLVYRRFRALLETLQPAYAAITNEYGMECPADLRRDPRSHAFRDFFVSGAYVGASTLDRIKTVFADAYVESIGHGLYISSTAEFNPNNQSVDATQATRQSGEVARLLAAAASQPL